MELFFSPLACSMATRIALYEAGANAVFQQVDLSTKRLLADGSDFMAINGMGQVPALRADDGEIISENPVVLQYVADRFPDSRLAPPAGDVERYRLQQWLNFIATELHKQVFIPLLEAKAPDGAKSFARERGAQAFAFLDRRLEGRETLLDHFTVADAYLTTVLHWSKAVAFDLTPYPHVLDYLKRMRRRPSVARAFEEETALYQETQARTKAA